MCEFLYGQLRPLGEACAFIVSGGTLYSEQPLEVGHRSEHVDERRTRGTGWIPPPGARNRPPMSMLCRASMPLTKTKGGAELTATL